MLLDKLKGIKGKKNKNTSMVIPISWKKMITAVAMITVGVWLGSIYLNDYSNMIAGAVSAVIISGGGFLFFNSLQQGESGFSMSKKKLTGNENAIIIFAKRNAEGLKDIPVIIKFAEIKHIPQGSRLHYVRNLRKHYYEFYNDTVNKKLVPVTLPDKKSFPPEQFQIPAAMQTYKDAIEYAPPTLLQKIAPGIMLAAMGVVGLLMVITGG